MVPPPEASNEPSIEEILDSIRQIIADDEGDAADEVAAAPVPEKADVAKVSETDIIELRDRIDEPAAPPPVKEPETAPVATQAPEPPPPPPPPPPARRPEPEPRPVMTTESDPIDNIEAIISKHAENATVKAFSELAQRASIEKGGGVTIEDVVRYEIRPLLRAWIDKYLPSIVERLVAKELERISRRFEQD